MRYLILTLLFICLIVFVGALFIDISKYIVSLAFLISALSLIYIQVNSKRKMNGKHEGVGNKNP